VEYTLDPWGEGWRNTTNDKVNPNNPLDSIAPIKVPKYDNDYQPLVNPRGGYRGCRWCTPPPPLKNDFVPFSFANLVYSYTMEGAKNCPICLCTSSLNKSNEKVTHPVPLHPLLTKFKRKCPIYPCIPSLRKPRIHPWIHPWTPLIFLHCTDSESY
jgi:hypothetical protein